VAATAASAPVPSAPVAEFLGVAAAHGASPHVAADPTPHADAPVARALGTATAHPGSPRVAADPTPHANAPVAQFLGAPTAHGSSPRLAVDPTPHANAPSAVPLGEPTAHGSSPRLAADPTPHANAPSAVPLGATTARGASARPAADPTPHANAPSAVPLGAPTAHGSSPRVGADPTPHANAPSAVPLGPPAAHGSAPRLGADPTPHANAPSAVTLGPPTAHGSARRLGADPTPHANAPTAERLGGPVAHAGSPEALEAGPVTPAGSAVPARPAESGQLGWLGAARGLVGAVRSAVGLASRATEVDHWGKDTELASALRPLGELLYDKYWRVRVEGAEFLPPGPCLLVANHAGALPLDGPVLHLALRRERPELPDARWLLEDQVFHAPFVGVLANRIGAVRASPENALRLLDEGRPLVVFPEGFHGLSKPFAERYQLRRFGRGGYVKIALRAKVPVLPVAIIGGEESMPLLGKLPGGLFGVQYLPVTLPPLPARWHIRIAPPVDLSGAPAEPEQDLAWVERTNLAVRDQIEGMLTDMLQHRERVF
jgi:1-acyl-sn-glycerol-3-phosphate acyltransferase